MPVDNNRFYIEHSRKTYNITMREDKKQTEKYQTATSTQATHKKIKRSKSKKKQGNLKN